MWQHYWFVNFVTNFSTLQARSNNSYCLGLYAVAIITLAMKGMPKRRVLYVFTLMLLLIAAGLAFYFGYYVPGTQDAAYNANLVRATNLLLDDSKHVVDTASLPIFNDINETPTTCEDNVASVTSTVNQFDSYLSDLERLAGTSRSDYLYGLGTDAARTRARKIRAEAIVKQSRQVLAEYTAMTAFLQNLADIRKDYIEITTPLTVAGDLYNYAYRTAELRADAAVIDTLASKVLAIKAPTELIATQNSIAAQYKETAAGYYDLAYGLLLANDTLVYAAARRIEAAMAQLDGNVQAQYSTAMNNSVVIKELGELPDKYVLD